MQARCSSGGSMCGTAKFLKEQRSKRSNSGNSITYGSVSKKYKETGVFDEKEVILTSPRELEKNLQRMLNFDMIDHFVQGADKDDASK